MVEQKMAGRVCGACMRGSCMTCYTPGCACKANNHRSSKGKGAGKK